MRLYSSEPRTGVGPHNCERRLGIVRVRDRWGFNQTDVMWGRLQLYATRHPWQGELGLEKRRLDFGWCSKKLARLTFGGFRSGEA
jgi:hypothetical protein